MKVETEEQAKELIKDICEWFSKNKLDLTPSNESSDPHIVELSRLFANEILDSADAWKYSQSGCSLCKG